MDLLQNLAGRSQRLGENGPFIRYAVGYGVEQLGGQGEGVGHRPVAAVDTERGAVGALSRVAPAAGRAVAAVGVDLTHYALPYPLRRRVGLFNHTDKLMAEDALEAHITAHNLDIGVANAGQGRAN